MDNNSAQTKSEILFERAKKVLPGGVSRNTIFKQPNPDYAQFAQGCYVTDIDGRKHLDFANNMASLIHGHAEPSITAAIIEQVQKGTAFTLATEAEVEYAELLCARSPSFDKIRFVNSGTEAVMAMIKAARAYTGKSKIAKVEGAYHGAYDYAEVSQTAGPETWGKQSSPHSVPVANGTPEGALDDVIVIPYNDIEATLTLLAQYKNEIAGILIDPISHRVGMVPATDEYIAALYKWSRENAALLMFDEVITFRCGYGGAQERYKVSPDLTALGKMIGGGFPVGAIAGAKQIMKVFDPSEPKVLLPHSGTFSANPVTMVAGKAAMALFDQTAVAKLNELGDYARNEISEAISKVGVKACVTGVGSMFRLHFKQSAPSNYRQTYATAEEANAVKLLLKHLSENNIMMINTCSAMLSTVMTTNEIDYLIKHLTSGLKLIKVKYPELSA